MEGPPILPTLGCEVLVLHEAGRGSAAPPPRVLPAPVFWREGFSIDDGPLMEFGVPENEEILAAINNG